MRHTTFFRTSDITAQHPCDWVLKHDLNFKRAFRLALIGCMCGLLAAPASAQNTRQPQQLSVEEFQTLYGNPAKAGKSKAADPRSYNPASAYPAQSKQSFSAEELAEDIVCDTSQLAICKRQLDRSMSRCTSAASACVNTSSNRNEDASCRMLRCAEEQPDCLQRAIETYQSCMGMEVPKAHSDTDNSEQREATP